MIYANSKSKEDSYCQNKLTNRFPFLLSNRLQIACRSANTPVNQLNCERPTYFNQNVCVYVETNWSVERKLQLQS